MRVSGVKTTKHVEPTFTAASNEHQNHSIKKGQINDEDKETKTNKQHVEEEAVLKAIEKANTSLELTQTKFEFSIHEKTKEIIVKVYNKETNELIREIPPEKILNLVAKIWEMAGIIIDERV